MKQAEIDIEYSKVYAPISGHISVSYFTKGALAKKDENSVLAIINQIDPVFVDVRYPASDFSVIRQHLNAKVSVEMSNGKVISGGMIDSFEREIDQSSDSFLVRVRMDNKDLDLIPGMYVKAIFSLESTQGLTIPIKATYRDVDGSLFVCHVNEQNIVSKKTIIANRIFGNRWVVESGLTENEAIIYEGVQKVYEGALVNPNVAREVK
jgi:membrane fusion protein (multidrug efflux system)